MRQAREGRGEGREEKVTEEVLSASLRLQRPDTGWHRIGAQYLFQGGSPNEWTNDAVSAAVVKSLPLRTPVSLCKMAIAAWVRRRAAGVRWRAKGVQPADDRGLAPFASLESARGARGGRGHAGVRGPSPRAARECVWEARVASGRRAWGAEGAGRSHPLCQRPPLGCGR